MNPAQVSLLRKQTRFFIKEDASVIIPSQPEFSADGAGGRVAVDAEERPEQTVRVIPLTSNASLTLTLEGEEVRVDFILMGEHDADVRVGDHFEARGLEFKIIHIQEKRDYQTKAELITVAKA